MCDVVKCPGFHNKSMRSIIRFFSPLCHRKDESRHAVKYLAHHSNGEVSIDHHNTPTHLYPTVLLLKATLRANFTCVAVLLQSETYTLTLWEQ